MVLSHCLQPPPKTLLRSLLIPSGVLPGLNAPFNPFRTALLCRAHLPPTPGDLVWALWKQRTAGQGRLIIQCPWKLPPTNPPSLPPAKDSTLLSFHLLQFSPNFMKSSLSSCFQMRCSIITTSQKRTHLLSEHNRTTLVSNLILVQDWRKSTLNIHRKDQCWS